MFYKLKTFVVFFKNLVELEFLENIWRRNNGTNVVDKGDRRGTMVGLDANVMTKRVAYVQ